MHSSVFDVNRVFIFDEVIRRLVRIPRIDELRETTEFNSRVEVIGGVSRRFVEVPARQFSLAEPTEAWVGNDVINAVEVLIKDLGGVATLKALGGDLVGQEAVIKALSMGYVVFNPSDMTVRATGRALSLVKSLKR